MDQQKIGKFIARCRKEKGITQLQLAEKFGISDRAVSKWETGKSCPDPSIMIELCDFLEISVDELLNGERLNQENNTNNDATNELKGKLEAYKRRLIVNNVFLLIVAIISAFTMPIGLIFIVAVAIFRNYYLIKNVKAINQMIKNK